MSRVDYYAISDNGTNPDNTTSYRVLSESGNPIYVEDAKAEKVETLSIDLEPVQDLNGYDAPWVGGAGKNILKPIDYTEGRYVRSSDGNTTANDSYDATDYLPVTANTAYHFGYLVNTATLAGIAFFDSSKTYISGASNITLGRNNNTVTSPENAAFVRASILKIEDFNPNWQTTAYICKSGDLTTYEPYENICPIIAANGKNVVNADGMVNDNFVKNGNDYVFTQNGNGASARSTGYAPFSAVINEPYTFSFIIDNTGGMTNTFEYQAVTKQPHLHRQKKLRRFGCTRLHQMLMLENLSK